MLTSKIFSSLGNNSSLIPLGVKDMSNTLGITAGSYITGDQIEGKDRFIDELGTQVIWLLGIPFFKKIIDKTVYKLAKFNPNIDTRILKNKDIFKKAQEHAPESVKASFEKIAQSAKNEKMFKGLALAKFVAATALTLGSYSLLTTFRHKHTEKAIIKEIKKEEEAKKAQEIAKNNINKDQKNPSFGMNLNSLSQFMFDPVKNTMIIDGGITTERLADARNPQDFMGYVIKEGGFWAFMYFAGPAIQKYLEKKAAKNNKPIDLDIRVLQDAKFQDIMKTMKEKDIEIMSKELNLDKTDAEIYESLFKKAGKEDNLIVKVAKQSDIIKTIKDSGEIDTQHYIDIEAVKGIKGKIENLQKSLTAETKEGAETFFNRILKLKRASIITNIGASIGALGLLVPAIMVAMRFMDKDNKEFMVKKQIYEKMQKESLKTKDVV